MPEKKYESKPCGNCGGTVYYRGAGCVACVSRRTHESYHGRRREIARLRTENIDLRVALEAIASGASNPRQIAANALDNASGEES